MVLKGSLCELVRDFAKNPDKDYCLVGITVFLFSLNLAPNAVENIFGGVFDLIAELG